MKTWFSIKAQADASKPAEISIHDVIGMWGISAQAFIAELKKIDNKTIIVSINSPGGSLFDALAMYNALRNSGAHITTKVMGVAASAASVVFMAGDKRIMPENTFLMVHNVIGPLNGNADEHREFADLLDKINQSIVTTYVARTGKSEEEVKALLAKEEFLSAAQAKADGFADEIEAALKITAEFELDLLPENIQAAFKAANKVEDPSIDNTPPIQTSATFAAQLKAMAEAAGMKDYVATWLLDASIVNMDQAKAVINEAIEISALCEHAKFPDVAAKLINSRTSLADARTQLFAAQAEASDGQRVDNTQPGAGKKPPKSEPQAASFKTADIWAARQKH